MINFLTFEQGKSAIEVFNLIGLTTKDIDRMYSAFCDVDADDSGEFFLCKSFEPSPEIIRFYRHCESN